MTQSGLPSYLEQSDAVRERFARIREREVILEVRNLHKRYPAPGGETEALRDVSFRIHRREFVCVIGASGCGKSTLIRTLAGLEKHSAGEVLLDGKPVDGPGRDRGMVAKIIVRADDRVAAIDALIAALDRTRVHGIETNLAYLRQILDGDVFRAGLQTTHYLNRFRYVPHTVEVLEAGVQTTVQDWPGRVGYWDVGVPPSGPMDDLSLRAANRLVGNPEGTAGLECTMRTMRRAASSSTFWPEERFSSTFSISPLARISTVSVRLPYSLPRAAGG